jgi:hypothetical protein
VGVADDPGMPSPRTVLAGAALAALTAIAPAAANEPGAAARGQVVKSLVRATSSDCDGLLAGVRSRVCTHGPDPAPAGRDVRKRRSIGELRRAAGLGAPDGTARTTAGTINPTTDGSGAIVCSGDGVSGKRVQVLYVVAADRPDRYLSLVDALGQYTLRADGQLNASALNSGAVRHFRFVTAGDGAGGCVLDVQRVAIGATEDDTWDTMIPALKTQGYNRTDRKYLIYADTNVYCGLGSYYTDSQPGQTNVANGTRPEYARVDSGCWNYGEAHELMHTLGGVQTDAPHATPGGHCFDEYDALCYADGSGVRMQYICASSQSALFDCNGDDYFLATAPPAGSYLATHWNTADSAFLIGADLAPVPPPTTTTTTTTTESLSGSFKKAGSTATTRNAQAGATRAVASGTAHNKPAGLTLVVRDAAGQVIAQQSGTSIDVASTLIAAGAYTWALSAGSGVSWKMTLSYVAG